MALTKVSSNVVDNQLFGRRNLFINGAMAVAQRTTSATGQTGTGFHTVDRWEFVASSAGTWTITRDTTVPSGEGFAYSQKLDCTTADSSLDAGNYLIWRQKIEGINLQNLKFGTSSAEKLTLSFWVRSAKTGTYIVEFYNNNSGGIRRQSQSYTISSADTWEKKTITIDGDTATAFQNTTDGELLMYWWLAAGSTYQGGTLQTSWATNNANNTRAQGQVNLADSTSNDWYITGVQIEAGDNATPFEHRPFNQELIECRRYFERKIAKANTFLLIGQSFNTTAAYGTFDYQVEKRGDPSISFSGEGTGSTQWQWLTTAGGSPSGTGSTTGHTMTTWNARLQAASYTGLTNQAPSGFYSFGTAYVDIDAEIQMEGIMNITSAKYEKEAISGEVDIIVAVIDGVKLSVPISEGNRHYKAILAWVEAGNKIEPAD